MEGLGSRARQAEVEVKVERRPDVLHPSLNLSLDLNLFRAVDFFSILLVGWLVIQFTHLSEMNAWAGPQSSNKSTKAAGDAKRGRAVFNERVCATTAMALMGTRTNDRNSQPTPLRSSLNSIRNRSI